MPDYDPERPYVQRSKRQEWSAAGNKGYEVGLII